jgi:hypothetical protein
VTSAAILSEVASLDGRCCAGMRLAAAIGVVRLRGVLTCDIDDGSRWYALSLPLPHWPNYCCLITAPMLLDSAPQVVAFPTRQIPQLTPPSTTLTSPLFRRWCFHQRQRPTTTVANNSIIFLSNSISASGGKAPVRSNVHMRAVSCGWRRFVHCVSRS